MRKIVLLVAFMVVMFTMMAQSGINRDFDRVLPIHISKKRCPDITSLSEYPKLPNASAIEPNSVSDIMVVGDVLRLDSIESVSNHFYSYPIKEYLSYDSRGLVTSKVQCIFKDSKWVNNFKSEHVYNERGLEIISIDYEWGGGQWAINDKIEFKYNNQGLITSEIKYYWIDSKWIIGYKEEYEYNENDLITSIICSMFYETYWVVISKYEWEYNSKNQEVLYVYYDLDGSLLVVNTKFELEYNDRGLLTSLIYSRWEHCQLLVEKYEWKHNDRGLPISKIVSWYNLSQWNVVSKDEYTYNDKNFMVSMVGYLYEDSKWVHLYKNDYVYDKNDLMISEISYSWKSYSWKFTHKYDCEYNEQNLIISKIYLIWKNSEWFYFDKDEWKYNSFGLLTYSAEFVWRVSEWIIRYSNEWSYYEPLSSFVYSDITHLCMKSGYALSSHKCFDGSIDSEKKYYYSKVTQGVEEDDNSLSVRLYPNPFEDVLHIDVEDVENCILEVYNVMGQLVFRDKATTKVYLTGLKSGIYFVKMIGNDSQFLERIVKR